MFSGAQALLGFQFVGVFLGGFEELPASSQYIHVVSLTLVTLSTILLMMPAAYHRLVEQGQPSQHFLRLTRNAVVGAMIPLGAGICGDFFIVIRKVSGSVLVASSTSLILLAMFYILWFGLRLCAVEIERPYWSSATNSKPGKEVAILHRQDRELLLKGSVVPFVIEPEEDSDSACH